MATGGEHLLSGTTQIPSATGSAAGGRQGLLRRAAVACFVPGLLLPLAVWLYIVPRLVETYAEARRTGSWPLESFPNWRLFAEIGIGASLLLGLAGVVVVGLGMRYTRLKEGGCAAAFVALSVFALIVAVNAIAGLGVALSGMP